MNCIIRRADPEKDAEAINTIRLQPEVMKTIASLPSEEVQVTRQYLDRGTGELFVAEKTDKPEMVVGYLALQPSEEPHHEHVAYLGIMIHKNYHRHGIGRLLMEKAIDTASNLLKIKRIELDVDISNEGAIRLYESMGFKKEGILRKTTVTRGAYVDDFLMARLEPPGMDFERADGNVSEPKGVMAGRGNYSIRPVDIKDADELCRLYEKLEASKELEELQRDLKNLNYDKHRFVAIEPGTTKICGFAILSVSKIQRMRHRGEMHLLIPRDNEPEIISKLVGAIVDLSDNWLCLVRLEAIVRSIDAGMLSVYKKMGFEVEARKEKSVFYNGKYLDEYVLGRVRQVTFEAPQS